MSQRTNQQRKLTIGSFWQNYPWPYRLKSAIFVLIEFIFLAFSIHRKVKEQGKHQCLINPTACKNLQLALNITIVLHGLHVSRLAYKVVTTYYKKRSIVSGLIKCCLMDCYCSCAGFTYCFVQICYYANWKKCIDLSKDNPKYSKYDLDEEKAPTSECLPK